MAFPFLANPTPQPSAPPLPLASSRGWQPAAKRLEMHPMHKASPGQRPRRGRHQEQPAERAGPMRIAKALARAGLCSRREAERWIELGRVNVNGKLLTTPAFEISGKDKVLVDGKPLPTAEPPQLWRYYK